MPEEYLQVQCLKCKLSWNYYDERIDADAKLSAITIQGIICPQCGKFGIITTTTKEQDNVRPTPSNFNQF